MMSDANVQFYMKAVGDELHEEVQKLDIFNHLWLANRQKNYIWLKYLKNASAQ